MVSYCAAHAAQRMQDYIEENIGNTITLDDLSGSVNYSRSHALRIFKAATGLTPFEYIRQYRLTQGARRLSGGDVRIADVASYCAFDTHEGFTRAFSKEFGLSPEAYKADPVPVRYFVPYSVLIRYLVDNKGEKKMDNNKQTVFVQVAERPERKAVIIVNYQTYLNNYINIPLWQDRKRSA